MDEILDRPASRASSIATQATGFGGSRSLAQEVEHIKTLITRASSAPRQPEGSITAQVFRRRASPQHNVTQAQIFQELDALKRRIRHEVQAQPERRPSIADPESSESESEAEEVTDEREEELEKVKEELELVKAQREHWIEDAEARIDRIMGKKEEVDDRLREAQNKTKDLQEQLEETERELDISKEECGKTHAQFVETQAGFRSLSSEKQELQRQVDDLSLIHI